MKPTDLRWQLYQFIEHMLNGYGHLTFISIIILKLWSRYGLNGHACLLEAICEANNIKFAKDFSTAGEMLHLLLRWII